MSLVEGGVLLISQDLYILKRDVLRLNLYSERLLDQVLVSSFESCLESIMALDFDALFHLAFS